MITLKEQINFEVQKVLLEVRTGFRFDEFKSIEPEVDEPEMWAQERRVEYAKKHLKRLGRGGSRIAFLLSNRFVLKLADPGNYNFGKEQNQVEVDVFTNPKIGPIVTKVFDSDPKYNWIVAELVRPLKSGHEFDELTGMSFGVLTKIMAVLSMTPIRTQEDAEEAFRDRIEDHKISLEKIKGLEPHRQEMLSAQVRSLMRDDEKMLASLKNPIVLPVLNLMTYGRINNSDLSRIEHWGKTPDGRVVILDYGYTV